MAAKIESAKSNSAGKTKKVETKKTEKKTKKLTANEQLLRAWQKTYDNRHQRVD